jgi:hypothetical protein
MSSQSAVVAQTTLPATHEAAEAMVTPAAKRARVEEPKAFGDVDVETASLKIVEGNEKYMIPLFDNEVAYIVLTPSAPTKIAHGFGTQGQYEQRSFNSPGTKAAGNESLAIQIELDNEQVKFFEMVDAKFKTLFPTEEKYEWTSLLRTTKHNETAAKVNVCLSGEESALTLLKFIRDGKVESGKGCDYFKAQADVEKAGAYAFGGGELKVTVKLRAWSMTGKDGVIRKGLSLAATHVMSPVKLHLSQVTHQTLYIS